jgi:hypothetical protein
VGIYLYFRSKKSNPKLETGNASLTVEEMWERAEGKMAEVLSKSPSLENYLQDERDMVKAMESDMIRLRERFKHDPKKQSEVARDWMDYSSAVARIKFSREWFDCDDKDTALDSHTERTREPYVTVQEIGKRVEDILGKDSSSKLVHDRLRKNAEAVNEVFAERREKTILDGKDAKKV